MTIEEIYDTFRKVIIDKKNLEDPLHSLEIAYYALCDDCGKAIYENNNFYYGYNQSGNPHFCKECEQKNHCMYCLKRTDNEIKICDECLKKCKKCEDCGKYIKDYKEISEGKYICLSCLLNYKQCSCCGTYVQQDSIFYYYSDRKYYCPKCKEEHIFQCQLCNQLFSKTVMSEVDNCCKYCIPENKVLQYSYKPTYFKSFKEENDDGILMGIEFEIGGASKSQIVNKVVEKFKNYNYVYFKHDSSIPNYGVEIVSFPATLNAHKNILSWKDIFEMINNDEIRMNNSNGCGIHCHFTKNDLTNLQIAKLDSFVNINNEFIEKYCGRPFNRYCSPYLKKSNDWGFDDGNRGCVNLQNEKTIELRFCASTNKYDEFIKRLELLHSIFMFVKTTKFETKQIMGRRDFVFNKYKQFAKENYNFIKKRKNNSN